MKLEMRVTTLQMIFLAFIIIWEEGQIYVNSMGSRKVAVLKTQDSEEDTANIAVSEDVKNVSLEVEENIVEDQSDLLVPDDTINVEIKNKYIAHHRGNRRYLADEYSEQLSEITGGNYNLKEVNDYINVGETSKEHIDSNIISNTYSRETTKHHAKDLGKRINNKNEYETNSNSVIDSQDGVIENKKLLNNVEVHNNIFDTSDNFVGLNDNHDSMEVPVKQSIRNEDNYESINEESYEYENVIKNEEDDNDDDYDEDYNDDESDILPDVEGFWDAVDTFINIHSDHHEREGPQENEDLYEYLYSPSGNSPGIDQFVDLLLFVKDVGDSVERIGKGSSFSLKNSSHARNPRKKRCTTSEVPSKRSNTKSHKAYSATLGFDFSILQFDIPFSHVKFFPFQDPYGL